MTAATHVHRSLAGGRWLWLLGAVAGCGRISFDTSSDAGSARDTQQDSRVVHSSPPRVLLFGDPPGVGPHTMFDSWIPAHAATVQSVSDDIVQPSTLAPYDLVIVQSLQHTLASDEGTTLDEFVSAGGGVVVMTGFGTLNEDQLFMSAIGAFGATVDGYIANGPATFVPHPVTTGVAPATFDGGWAIASPPPTVIATIAGSIVGAAIERGAGHAVLWGDEFIMLDSEWAGTQRLWANIFDWEWPTQ